MRRIFTGLLMTFGVLAAIPVNTASGDADRPRTGTAVAVTWEDGTLLLRDAEGFPLVVIGPNAPITNAKGAPMALKDIAAAVMKTEHFIGRNAKSVYNKMNSDLSKNAKVKKVGPGLYQLKK